MSHMSCRNSVGKRCLHLLMVFTVVSVIMAGVIVDSADSAGKFPDRPVTFIVPWAVGGATDLRCRLICQYAEQYLGVPLVVVNKPGGGSTVGMTELAHSPADGYTVGVLSTSLVVNQYLSEIEVSLDDYIPVAFIGYSIPTLTVRADSEWKTLKDFLEYAKANPGKIRNANDQIGGGSHLAAVEVERACGIEMNLIPYSGYAPSVAALLGGHVESTTAPVPDVQSLVESGELRVLGIVASERHFMMPDVPTFMEQGYDADRPSWSAIVAPRNIPTDRIAILEQAFMKAMQDPKLQETALKAGWEIGPEDSAWTSEFFEKDHVKLRSVLSTLGF